ncbi:hypothetical protein EJ04DRAFT_511641 [Polyplosphaeria fusca]|uniref:Uncharacterized protein n=1 Tax=Polyplosphaeria fusca TaxID=682080 RepID=A0A9P4V4U2_9PLEO|nr:hypothetical protein EJ04DRAFT_511641 [Polyplosphaeria fusca]
MVRVSSIVTILLSVAVGTQAAAFCQCLYADGSHCCVDDDAPGGCTAVCMNAVSVDGNKPCNAGGKYSKVSAWNGQFRTACK